MTSPGQSEHLGAVSIGKQLAVSLFRNMYFLIFSIFGPFLHFAKNLTK